MRFATGLACCGHCVQRQLRIEMTGGGEIDISVGDIFTIPPGGCDAWVVGGETAVIHNLGG